MENYSDKELDEVKKLFATYKGQYDKIKKTIKPERWVWSDGPALSLLPFSVERGRYKPGKIFKKEPKAKKNVVGYGYAGDDIVHVMVYGDLMLLKETFRICPSKDRIINIAFSHSNKPNTLYEITLCNLDNGKPSNSLYYMLDGVEQQIIKEIYSWDKNLLKNITVRGVNFFEDIEEVILKSYAMEYDANGSLSRILSKNGKVVFPK